MVENVQKSLSERLKALEEESKKRGSMVPFNAVVVSVGVPVTPHYPKLKDAQGNDVLDEKGHTKYSEQSDGFNYWFTTFGKRQLVNAVFRSEKEMPPLKTYRLTGFGYDIRNAGVSTFYIKDEPKLGNW